MSRLEEIFKNKFEYNMNKFKFRKNCNRLNVTLGDSVHDDYLMYHLLCCHKKENCYLL